MSKAIGVRVGESQSPHSTEEPTVVRIEWHAPGAGVTDHHTLCGMDADDPTIGLFGFVQPKRGQKITCDTCKAMWKGTMALRLRASDFE